MFFLIPAISVYTVVLGFVSIVSSLFDRRGYFAHRCARAWSWLILKTTGVRVEVEGLERIVPGKTYVFVSNHQSIYDTPVIFASLPYQIRIIAKTSLAKFPVLGWHLRRGGHLFVDRRHPDRAGILKRWRALVSEGLSLIIYAEGTRSPDGHVARFKAGSFLLAIEAGLPIVPLAVIGTRQVMPKGRLRTEPADVRAGRPRADSATGHPESDRRRTPRRLPTGPRHRCGDRRETAESEQLQKKIVSRNGRIPDAVLPPSVPSYVLRRPLQSCNPAILQFSPYVRNRDHRGRGPRPPIRRARAQAVARDRWPLHSRAERGRVSRPSVD